MYRSKNITSDEIRCALQDNPKERVTRDIRYLAECVAALAKVYREVDGTRFDENAFGPALLCVKTLLDTATGTETRAMANRLASDFVRELSDVYRESGSDVPSFRSELNVLANRARALLKGDSEYVERTASREFDALFKLLNSMKLPVDELRGINGEGTIEGIRQRANDPRMRQAVESLVSGIAGACKDADIITEVFVPADAARRFLWAASDLAFMIERLTGSDVDIRREIELFLKTDFKGEEPTLRRLDRNAKVEGKMIERLNTYFYELNKHYNMLRKEMLQIGPESTVAEAISMFLGMNREWLVNSKSIMADQRGELIEKTETMKGSVSAGLFDYKTCEGIGFLSKRELELYISSLDIDVRVEIGEYAGKLLENKGRYLGFDRDWMCLYTEIYERYKRSWRGGKLVPLPPPAVF